MDEIKIEKKIADNEFYFWVLENFTDMDIHNLSILIYYEKMKKIRSRKEVIEKIMVAKRRWISHQCDDKFFLEGGHYSQEIKNSFQITETYTMPVIGVEGFYGKGVGFKSVKYSGIHFTFSNLLSIDAGDVKKSFIAIFRHPTDSWFTLRTFRSLASRIISGESWKM